MWGLANLFFWNSHWCLKTPTNNKLKQTTLATPFPPHSTPEFNGSLGVLNRNSSVFCYTASMVSEGILELTGSPAGITAATYFCCASIVVQYTATRYRGTGCDQSLIRTLFNIAELKTCIRMTEMFLARIHSIQVCSWTGWVSILAQKWHLCHFKTFLWSSAASLDRFLVFPSVFTL